MKRPMLMLALQLCLGPSAAPWAQAAPPSPAEIARQAGELMARAYRADAPGGAVLVARGDTVLFRAARGEADVEKHVPLRPDSVFRIGSVTKQFSAAGLLTLVEAGKVKLEDPLSKYVPGYPGGERITVLQLLNHTSGVRSYTDLPGYMDGPIVRDLTTAQMIDVFKNEAPVSEPGAKWAYNNSGYVLVGAVIEAASGMPWHAYLEQALVKPLGLTHTGYGHDSKLAGQVRGYSYDGDQVVPMKPLSMTQPHAAGSLLSNVDDLFKWNRALHEGRVLKSATYAKMITPVGKAAEPGAGYGFGLYTGKVRKNGVLRHGGAIAGFMSSLSYLPGPDITVVILENDDATGDLDDAATLARKLAAIALGDPYPPLRAVPVTPAALQAAEGLYRFGADTTRRLHVVDGALTAQRDRGPPVVLTPIAAGDFLYPDGFNRLQLEREAGKVTRIRFFAGGDGDGEVGVRTGEPPPGPPVAVRLPRAALERVTGSYASGALTLKVFLDGASLKGQLAGQPPIGLRAVSATLFDVEETGATVEFSPGDAPPAQVTLRQNGRELVLQRVP